MVLSWIFFSLSKFRGISVLWKKAVFSCFPWPHRKKIQRIFIRTILKFDDLPIAHLETVVPLFLKHLWKLGISLKLWVPAHSKVSWSRTMTAKMSVFRPLFWRKSLFWPIPTQWTPPSVIHGWKATDLLFLMVKRYQSRERDFLLESDFLFSNKKSDSTASGCEVRRRRLFYWSHSSKKTPSPHLTARSTYHCKPIFYLKFGMTSL